MDIKIGDKLKWIGDETIYTIIDIDTSRPSDQICYEWIWSSTHEHMTRYCHTYDHLIDMIHWGGVKKINRYDIVKYLKPFKFT